MRSRTPILCCILTTSKLPTFLTYAASDLSEENKTNEGPYTSSSESYRNEVRVGASRSCGLCLVIRVGGSDVSDSSEEKE